MKAVNTFKTQTQPLTGKKRGLIRRAQERLGNQALILVTLSLGVLALQQYALACMMLVVTVLLHDEKEDGKYWFNRIYKMDFRQYAPRRYRLSESAQYALEGFSVIVAVIFLWFVAEIIF